MSLRSKLTTAVKASREEGWPRLAELLRWRLVAPLIQPIVSRLKAHSTFTFRGRAYSYCCAAYTFAWGSERTVEAPIFERLLREHGGRVLEVGNVLPHYFPCAHTVVDQYEQAPGVINEDVVDYTPDQPYDLILSISTLEHVGGDEEPREPEGPQRALDNLRRHLAPGGLLVFSVPLGWNTQLDGCLRDGRIALDEQHCLRRVGALNNWVETDLETALLQPYDRRHRHANAICLGFIQRPAESS